MYDPRFNQDDMNGPQVIPPAYGLLGINRITATGDGDKLEYWNRYVGGHADGRTRFVHGAAHGRQRDQRDR